MQISSGYLKGRKLEAPKGIRPTQNKVRKAVFDILQQELEGGSFLELFAGSGAVGLEAISNGAKEVVLVEKDRANAKTIESNIKKLDSGKTDFKLNESISIYNMDAFTAIEAFAKEKRKFDIIFLDPPYYKDIAKKSLQRLALYDILSPHGLIIVEHHKKDFLDETFDGLTRFKQKGYGDKILSFYKK